MSAENVKYMYVVSMENFLVVLRSFSDQQFAQTKCIGAYRPPGQERVLKVSVNNLRPAAGVHITN